MEKGTQEDTPGCGETSLVSDMNSLIITQAASHEKCLLVGVKIDKSFIFSRWQSALD